jgi:tetratricopeptide (TPR) repeat protein
MPRLFISYRRSDTQMVAGRLRESLAGHFGDRAIFRDKNSIAPGEDWTKAIKEGLTGGVVVLALIGPRWATACDEAGHRRLDDPADWNRVELEHAFEQRSRVIPLLVDDAVMPAESALPESLKSLARSNALKLRDDDWDSDIDRLVRALGGRGAWSRMQRPALVATLAVIIAGATGYWWLRSWEGDEDPVPLAAGRVGSTYRSDVLEKLAQEQKQALVLLDADKPRAIRLIDDNLAGIAQALKSFPDDANLYALAGYGAKNVYASSKGVLGPDKRKDYLVRARTYFEQALRLDPKNPGAVNGMGNVLFYERRFDEASQQHEKAIHLAGGTYPEAEHDLNLVRLVKSGQVDFDP